MKYTEEYNLDDRTVRDIRNKIEELSKSYTPEWKFDCENPDIGSVIALIFSNQMEDNIKRFNRMLDRYQVEFINMLGISLLPAKPASAAVILNLASDTLPGMDVPKGTRLLGRSDNGDSGKMLVFETEYGIHVTEARMTDMVMVSADNGRILPLMGDFPVQELIEDPDEVRETESENLMQPFRLFDFSENGIERNVLLIYHSSIFDIEHEVVSVKFSGGEKLLEGIRRGEYKLSYYGQEGMIPAENIWTEGEILHFCKDRPCGKVEIEGKEQSLLVLESLVPVRETVELSGICLSSFGKEVCAQFVSNGTSDLEVENFKPFGDTLTLYSECYIGHMFYFSKPGSVLTLTFRVEFKENRLSFLAQEKDEKLKVIKRRPRQEDMAWAETFPQEISLEYYNGTGWKRLICKKDIRNIFAEGQSGNITIQFVCPEDWRETEIGGFLMPCIRMQLLKADNCYMQPCVHHYPCIRDLRISYTYDGSYVKPERLMAVYATHKEDLTGAVMRKKRFAAFRRSIYEETALYLGFDRPFDGGPVSLWFDIVEDGLREEKKLEYSYSTIRGFRQMKVLDGTKNLTIPGIIRFIPQSDMAETMLEGKKRYWLKIALPKEEGAMKEADKPEIRRILLNAVETSNIETLEEEEFYIDQVLPNMKFTLNAHHILDADIWVNETGRFSDRQMKQLLSEHPSEYKAEYNFLGEIQEFYVRWKEVTDFLRSGASDRHYILDRMNNELIFGDGVHAQMPQVTRGTALKADIRCSDGQEGNVEAYQIGDTASNLLFLDNIYNPVPAFGGSNMETVDAALCRGANMLSARNRLVTETDYVREVQNFSDNIDKVRCIMGKNPDGSYNDGEIRLVLLMQDFKKGSYSFHKIKTQLMEHLLKSCELSVEPEQLKITEPVFAEVSVHAWVKVLRQESSFEVKEMIEKTLENYLTPVKNGRNSGWEIGRMPKLSQIIMGLHTVRNKAVIRRLAVTVQYRDSTGIHEAELDELPPNPYFVCKNGVHHIYILSEQE